MAAIGVATDEGVSDEAISRALKGFSGVGRRFQVQGEFELGEGNVKLVDDYGHHPKEVEATIKAARQSHPDRRLVMLFQPHRYSRTRDCFDDFIEVLSQVDQLLLLEVYPAGEKPIVGADSRTLARSIRLRGQVEPILIDPVDGNLQNIMQNVLQPNDLLLTQGAGNVGAIHSRTCTAPFVCEINKKVLNYRVKDLNVSNATKFGKVAVLFGGKSAERAVL